MNWLLRLINKRNRELFDENKKLGSRITALETQLPKVMKKHDFIIAEHKEMMEVFDYLNRRLQGTWLSNEQKSIITRVNDMIRLIRVKRTWHEGE